MSGRPSDAVVIAVAMLRKSGGKMTAYAAAKQVGIALSTIYRSALYKAYKAEQEQANHKENNP